MALLEKQLVVKRSTIPGAGKGLFTKKLILKGERIIEYKGKQITWKEAKGQDDFNGYVFYIKRNLVIDSKKHMKAIARFTNDASGLTKVKGIRNNCIYVVEGSKVFVEALKNIEAGSELFVSYGKDYWDVVKHNLKHGFI